MQPVSVSLTKNSVFFYTAPAVIMSSHSSKPIGIVIIQMGGTLHKNWSVDSQQIIKTVATSCEI